MTLRLNQMSNAETLDKLLSPEQHEKDDRDEWRQTFIQISLLLILVILISTWVWGIIWSYTRPKIDDVAISNARVVGNSALCGGEVLIIAYDFHADGAGKLVESATAWKETPPKTIIYSEEDVFLLDGTIDQQTTIAWQVPVSYTNPSTAELEALPPGEYRRIFSVSSASRPSVFAMASVDFSVKKTC